MQHHSTNARSGLHIRGHRGHPAVRMAYIRFAVWLRTQFDFPIRVPVYLLPGECVRTVDGDIVTASIFLPWNRKTEPYIRVATGDFPRLNRELGRDNALAAFLSSLSHEVIHYRQWIETGDFRERGVALRASKLVVRYSETRGHP